jgi:cytochrome P450
VFNDGHFLDGGEAVAEGRPKCAYLPFSAGPRKCIGDALASLVQRIVVARLLARVRLAPVAGVEPILVVSLRARDGIRMTA